MAVYQIAESEELNNHAVSGDRCSVRCKTGLWQYAIAHRSTLMTWFQSIMSIRIEWKKRTRSIRIRRSVGTTFRTNDQTKLSCSRPMTPMSRSLDVSKHTHHHCYCSIADSISRCSSCEFRTSRWTHECKTEGEH